ncbi:hypothetical protein N7461_005005 [Penicillium sp. DV-2018c]|nr:hypothetical protein N7461_005005 [Penicillium sp. DV-2018c]
MAMSETTTSETTTSEMTTSETASSSEETTSPPTRASSSTGRTIATSATATGMAPEELQKWNHNGNIAAIVFGSCVGALFVIVITVDCVRERAKARRFANQELSKSNMSSSTLVPALQGDSAANLLPERRSTVFEYHARGSPSPTRSVPSSVYRSPGSAKTSFTPRARPPSRVRTWQAPIHDDIPLELDSLGGDGPHVPR